MYKIGSGDLVKEIIKVYRIVTCYDINFIPINRVFDAVHFHVYLDYVSYGMINNFGKYMVILDKSLRYFYLSDIKFFVKIHILLLITLEYHDLLFIILFQNNRHQI